MDYITLYKSSFVLWLFWQVSGVTLLGCIYYSGSFLFWDCYIWLKNPFMPLFYCCCCFILLLRGLFWFDFLKRVPRNLCENISLCERESNVYFALRFPLFPLVWILLVRQTCTLSFMAHLQADEPEELGTDQDVDQARSRMYSCRSIQWERVWFGRMTFTEAVLSGGEALSEESELQCSRGSGHWDNVGWDLCLKEFWGPFSSIPSPSLKSQFYGLMSYLYNL